MNRNSESHFANTPSLNISRSKFDRSFTHKTTYNSSDLIPIFCDTTIMPGDTVSMKMSQVVRMATPITPVMDNCNQDIYFFFVPYRLIWDHFKRFMGENDTAPWIQTTEYNIPQIWFPYGDMSLTSSDKGWHKGDLADYFGYPTEIGVTTSSGRDKFMASALPFRAYCLCWNEFFRDENLQNPVNVESDKDSTVNGWSGSETREDYDPVKHTVRGGKPLKVCKYHDYFTSCLPGPQRGPSVMIPLSNDKPTLRYTNNETPDFTYSSKDKEVLFMNQQEHIHAINTETNKWGNQDNTKGIGGFVNLAYQYSDDPTDIETIAQGPIAGEDYYDNSVFGPFYVDLSQATGATVNQLRQAFAIQKFYERQALGGTRYIEMVKSHFDVTNPDFRLQRPEYLGGKRIPINMNQVVQTTPTSGGSTPLGSTGAYSVTADNDEMFTHSFTEHGILLGLACIRTTHTYQQGINAQYLKKKFTDFYFPEFANLGNMAVYNKEIFYADGDAAAKNDEAFGYQEAWATERYFPDIVTGEFRSNYTQSLDIWHYADYYEELPKLGDKWIQETEDNIERTLAVQDHDQFIADYYFAATYTRPMPLYSIPGLIDHH